MSSNIVSLRSFFQPAHVAVIGASAAPGKLGNTVFRNLIRGGFKGTLTPINARGDAVEGHPGYRSVTEVPTPIDCAFIAIPAEGVVQAVEECVRSGVRSIVIGASGFSEQGTPEGAARQERIQQIARASKCRIIGPNTNGLLSLHDAVVMGYNAAHGEQYDIGPVSIISHSGALFDAVAKRLRGFGVGLSKFVAVGNEADVSMLDMLEFLIDDDTTQIVGLIIEGMDDIPRLRELASRLAQVGKRVVALKIGRSREGAGATLAHSSRLAGSERAWKAIFSACGFAPATTIEGLAGSCALLARTHLDSADKRIVFVTTSGAGGALMLDLATDRQLPIAPQWSAALAKALHELPHVAELRQPIDMGNLRSWSDLDAVFKTIESDGYLGPTVTYAHVGAAPGMDEGLLNSLLARRERLGALSMVVSPGGLLPEIEARYRNAGIPVFNDMTTAFDSLSNCYFAFQPYAAADVKAERPAHSALKDSARADIAALNNVPKGTSLSEGDSVAILRDFGVPFVPHRRVPGELQALLVAARETGYPVVLKAMAPGVAHKHAAGLVAVDINSDSQLAAVFQEQCQRVESLGLRENTEWLVQPMLRADVELLAGITFEPGLGYFLVCGMGGVYTESFAQTLTLCAPCTVNELKAELQASFIGTILRAINPQGQALQRVTEVLDALQRAAISSKGQIKSIDINPLLVADNECTAVDALLVI